MPLYPNSPNIASGINSDALRNASELYFASRCILMEKIGEGSYHQAFLLRLENHTGACEIVARVAKPVFPRDKMESEVATMRYLALHTTLPIPKVYYWNTDANNPVGAEYMFMEKACGVEASKVWDRLDMALKIVFVQDLAGYLYQAFMLRFTKAGSLYLSSPDKRRLNNKPPTFSLGPIISSPFYSKKDRSPVLSLPSRGPYDTVFELLAHWPKAELAYLKEHPQEAIRWLMTNGKEICWIHDPARLTVNSVTEKYKQALVILQKKVEICSIYGALPVSTGNPDPVFSPTEFTLHLDDLNLSNIMMDLATGHLTSFIDLEGIITVPLWLAVPLPRWLTKHSRYPDGRDDENSRNPPRHNREAREEYILRKAFLARMYELDSPSHYETVPSRPSSSSRHNTLRNGVTSKKGQWKRAFEDGASYRSAFLELTGPWIHSHGETNLASVDLLLKWAQDNPGVPELGDEAVEARMWKADGFGEGTDVQMANSSDEDNY